MRLGFAGAPFMWYISAGKMRAADGPLFTLTVRGQNERAFPCSHQYANLAHEKLLSLFFRLSFLPRSPIEIKSTSQRNQSVRASDVREDASTTGTRPGAR